ncbi:MAG: DUF2911 domain-containing protein [Saprospiraceae bacterium]|nr:DUF2911 domain-containing protein [Saprospiraceae bacterium]
MCRLYTGILILFSFFQVQAQIEVPPMSPLFQLKGTIGFSEVEVEYSRPSARERAVAGNLIPYGEVWRTGANASTKISFSEDVLIEGNPVQAGKYALYTIFREDSATIILSKNLTWWGSLGYEEADDYLRLKVKVKHPSSHYETFTISFSDFTRNSANFNMKWEHTKAMFKIESDIDSRIMQQIKDQIIDRDSDNMMAYFQAANYYYDTNQDAAKALVWINKVIDNSEAEQYWVVHAKAKILERLGRDKEAIQVAQHSMSLAQTGGNPDYVRLNQGLIDRIMNR